ncbi:MAG: hypothetical protein M1822_004743 [Bathelium mastoideum]|nr:MAG: hypothetical protein M1822_004743 [Bathelium mastoideum]
MCLSTTPPPLLEDGKLEAMGGEPHEVEPEKEKQTTVASSTVNGVEKPEILEDDAVDKPQETLIYPKGVEVLFIMLALMLSTTLISWDQTIVATAILKISDRFNSLDDISWYGSAYFMTLGAFPSLWGKVYKYSPLKTSLLVAIFIFELGSRSALASSIALGVYAISAFAAEPTKRATYTEVIGASHGVAAVAEPLICGGLTDGASWRWCFYINLPIGGLAAFAILLTFKTPQAAEVFEATFKEKLLHMDFLGTVLIMDSSVVIGLFVGFVVIVLALIIVEIWQGEHAMLTPRLMRQRTVWVNGVWGFLFAGSYFVTLYYPPIYFQSIDNVSPIGSGVQNIPLIMIFSFVTFTLGRAVTETGIAAPYLTASSRASGYGVALQVPVIIAQAFAAPSDMAPTTAIVIFCRSFVGAFLIAAAQSGFANQLEHKLARTAPSVDPALLTATGATSLHQLFSGAELDGVVRAYTWGIKVVFAITIATCSITVPVSLCGKWNSVNAKKGSDGDA